MKASDAVRELIDGLDRSGDALDESRLPDLIRATGGREPADAAEWLAFMFRDGGESPWGTHFCPLAVGTSDDGSFSTVPDIAPMTQEVVDYWAARADAARHPVLVARYAGLVWDMHHWLTKRRPDPKFARQRIDAAVAMAAGRMHVQTLSTWKILEHALDLASSINDAVRVDAVVEAILTFDEQAGDDHKPRTWRAFDLLSARKKPKLTEEQHQRLVAGLEGRLRRLAHPPEGPADAWATEAAALRLAAHYRRRNEAAEVERVLTTVEKAFAPMIAQATGILAQGWTRRIHDHYEAFGLREHAERLRQEMHSRGPAVRDGMAKMSASIEVTKAEMSEFTDAILSGGSPDKALSRVITYFVPSRDDLVERLRELREDMPLLALLSHELVDGHGRHVATVGSTEDDEDGRLVMEMGRDLMFSAPFLRAVLAEATQRGLLAKESLMAQAAQSPCFEPDSMGLLGRGLDAYFADDPIVAIHLLVPQVEAGLRRLALAVGVSPMRANRGGGFDSRLLDDVLRDEKFAEELPPELLLYFRVLLTDRRGVNLRNLVCHGMVPTAGFHSAWADRLLHVVLFLASARMRTSPVGDESSVGAEAPT